MSPAPPIGPARRFAPACVALALLAAWVSPARAQADPQASAAPAPVTAAPEDAGPVAEASARGRLIIVPYPIVDPALGNGVLVGPVWMRGGPRPDAGPAKPQAFGAGMLWTDGGSRGLVAFDHRAWKDGSWRTTMLAGDLDLHFAYAGIRLDQDDGFGFGIAARGGSASVEHTLGAGPHTINFSVFSAQADVSPDRPPPAGIEADFGTATLSGVSLGWSRDTRDDVFLPSTGSAQSAKVTVIPEALGASFNSQTVALKWTGYRALGQGVLGLRAKADLGFGDPPFYLRPYASFRGLPALRYAGEQVFSMEAEYRHRIHGSWDGLVFAGGGHVRSDFGGIEQEKTVAAGGVGIRFKVAKLFGLTFGLDLAQGPDGTVGYVQIGNAWNN